MKAKFNFEIMDLEDCKVAIPFGKGAESFHGVLKVNDTTVAILRLLENENSEAGIVEALLKEYSGDKEQITKYVHELLEKLMAEGLVE